MCVTSPAQVNQRQLTQFLAFEVTRVLAISKFTNISTTNFFKVSADMHSNPYQHIIIIARDMYLMKQWSK